jgi:membrane-bound serine protease (ClpP class)
MISQVLTIVLLVLAMLLAILLEILMPTFGLMALGALAAAVGALWLAFNFAPAAGWALLAAMLVGVPLYIYWLVRFLPKTRLGKRVFLPEEQNRSLGDGTPDVAELASLVGRRGVAETLLRPAGSVRVEGRRYDAVLEAGMAPKGTTVEVVGSSGTELVVRALEYPPQEQGEQQPG